MQILLPITTAGLGYDSSQNFHTNIYYSRVRLNDSDNISIQIQEYEFKNL